MSFLSRDFLPPDSIVDLTDDVEDKKTTKIYAMAKKKGPNIPPDYKRKFIARIKAARESVKDKYPTLHAFEEAMGLNLDTYKHTRPAHCCHAIIWRSSVNLLALPCGISSPGRLTDWNMIALKKKGSGKAA